MSNLGKFSFPPFLGPFRNSWTTFPRTPCATPLFTPLGRGSRESLGAELRLRRWGRGDVRLQERRITHFLRGLGPNRCVAGSSPAS